MSWEFEIRDNLLCVCGHKNASHSWSEEFGFGMGACGYRTWNGKGHPDIVLTPCSCQMFWMEDPLYSFVFALWSYCNRTLYRIREARRQANG